MTQPRRRPAHTWLLLLSLAGLVPACRSAGPAAPVTTSPSAVATPRAAEAPPAPEPAPLPAVAPAEGPAGPPPEMPREAGASSEELAEQEPEPGGADPEAIQKEALELCQSAAAALARGEREQAIQLVDRAYERMLSLPNNGDDTFLQGKEDIRQLVSELLRNAYRRDVAPPAPPSFDLGVPIVDNEHVRREIKSFTTVEREQFLEAYRRSGLYRPRILARLEAAHLPSQLAWLPLVESWFKVRALSRAGAVGLWQFIASTGLRYGLRRDGWIDERMDPEKSTDAAIAFLADLHGIFGDWPKALAAYNCGPARVARLQNRSRDVYVDFWDVYEQLPHETRRYVPRFVAALLIIQDPARYGMTLPEPLALAGDAGTVRTNRSVSLETLERTLGLPEKTLRELNPELRYEATPETDYDLRVPPAVAEDAASRIAQLPEWKRPRPAFVSHRVRSGQTLGEIARRYGTTVGAILRFNGLRSAHRLRVGQVLRIPVTTRAR